MNGRWTTIMDALQPASPEQAEYLSDEDYSRLNGAYHRIDAAEEFRQYVTARLWERYRLGPGDTVQADGRILRAGPSAPALGEGP